MNKGMKIPRAEGTGKKVVDQLKFGQGINRDVVVASVFKCIFGRKSIRTLRRNAAGRLQERESEEAVTTKDRRPGRPLSKAGSTVQKEEEKSLAFKPINKGESSSTASPGYYVKRKIKKDYGIMKKVGTNSRKRYRIRTLSSLQVILSLPVRISKARPQKNTSGHLTTEDYSIICMWLSKPSNFSACFGRPPASKENGYALMAAEVNRKSKSGLNISSKQMKERFKTYKAKYVKAKKLGDSTGFGVSEDDQSKGIITISQKLNNLCPCFEQMDVIFGSQPNITPPSVADTHKNSIETVTMVDEHIDENLPNLGESPFDNAGNSQNNTFEEREEGIENIQHHSDNDNHDLSITSNLSSNVPPESTPTNNTSGKRKASNSLNLNPESHKRGPKSTLASSYAELYESKFEEKKEYEVTKLNWEQQKWHLEKEQKDKERHMELAIREKEIQFAKDGKDKELEVKMLIADKDREAMKLKQDNAMLLAVVGSSRSIEEIAEISKILFNR
ncbi:hypothetical protein PPACK8108_LOCUS9815 [Phakopsora pachyrhizi]|uniref:Uncharacterized protein n=1 Tax=Phakopsora pachyrhizi TaxID=170000 RepID=A0AAV0B043_PHAPC|nr:hypothetical protein PPACK8108_LOCUS9815 [Phakopsora pachyrhizi]